MPFTDRRIGIWAKIERAKAHILEFENRVNAFRKTNPYRLITENNAKTGERIYKIGDHSDPPIELGLVAGEAIHQLRSSLDHLAWQLVEANTRTPSKGTYFPICKTAPATSMEKKSFATKVEGISAAAIRAIEMVQPYQSGVIDLWKLNELDTFDKHRLLFAIACDVAGANLTFTQGAQTPQSASIQISLPGASGSRKFKVLKDGTEIGRFTGNGCSDLNKNLKVSFEIAFGEPQIVEGEPVVPFLKQLAESVNDIIANFIPFL